MNAIDSVTKLSKIECTVPTEYQKAVLDVDITVVHGEAETEVTRRLARSSPGLTYAVVRAGGGSPPSAGLSIGADGVVSASAVGEFKMEASFEGATTTPPVAITAPANTEKG